MNIDECKTIKECLYWAESTWPGFWDFSTLQPMSDVEIQDLAANVKNDPNMHRLIKRIREVAKIDKTQEARTLLLMGAQSINRLQQQDTTHEHKRTKR